MARLLKKLRPGSEAHLALMRSIRAQARAPFPSHFRCTAQIFVAIGGTADMPKIRNGVQSAVYYPQRPRDVFSVLLVSSQPANSRSTAAAIRNRRWSWPFLATSISPTGRPPARGRGSEIAHRSKKLTQLVLRTRIACLARKVSGVPTSDNFGAT